MLLSANNQDAFTKLGMNNNKLQVNFQNFIAHSAQEANAISVCFVKSDSILLFGTDEVFLYKKCNIFYGMA